MRLDDLVANRTMSRDIADALRRVVRERRSFIVLAVPRLAGKSTVMRAMLAERPRSAPVRTLAEDGDDLARLFRESADGFLVIPEIARSAAMPGYIWGADVRRVFTAVPPNVSLVATLHADGTDDAFDQICRGCGIPDMQAERIAVSVHLRSIGRWEEPTRRVVQALDEIAGVREGKPRIKRLFHWDEKADRFAPS